MLKVSNLYNVVIQYNVTYTVYTLTNIFFMFLFLQTARLDATAKDAYEHIYNIMHILLMLFNDLLFSHKNVFE